MSGRACSTCVITRQLPRSSGAAGGTLLVGCNSLRTQWMQCRWPQEAMVPLTPHSIGSKHTGQWGRCSSLMSLDRVAALTRYCLTNAAAEAGGTCIERKTRWPAPHATQHPTSPPGPAQQHQANTTDLHKQPCPTDLQLLPLPHEACALGAAPLVLALIGFLQQQILDMHDQAHIHAQTHIHTHRHEQPRHAHVHARGWQTLKRQNAGGEMQGWRVHRGGAVVCPAAAGAQAAQRQCPHKAAWHVLSDSDSRTACRSGRHPTTRNARPRGGTQASATQGAR